MSIINCLKMHLQLDLTFQDIETLVHDLHP